MNPWIPITNTKDLKFLGKLGEELGEASSAVCRCIIQGLEEKEPVTEKVNKDWLEEELADVLANIELVTEHFQLDTIKILERSSKKKERLKIWHEAL